MPNGLPGFLVPHFDLSQPSDDSIDLHVGTSTDSGPSAWNFPFNGSTQLLPYPNKPGKYISQFALRPAGNTGGAVNPVMKNFTFNWIWLVNDRLQELFQPLEITVIADKE